MNRQQLEVALFIAGDNGTYQFRQTIIFTCVIFVVSFIVMSPTYLFAVPELVCNGGQCPKDCVASDVTLDVLKHNIATDLKLYCDRNIYKPTIQATFFVGAFFGGFILCYISDALGRKVGVLTSILFCLCGAICQVLSHNVIRFLISNFLLGFGQCGTYITVIVIINETYSQQMRQRMIIQMLMVWAISQLFAAMFYYYFNNWRYIYAAVTILPLLICSISIACIVSETPQYYYAQQNIEKCLKTLNYIADVNQRAQVTLADIEDDQEDGQSQTSSVYNVLDLFRYQSLRVGTIGFAVASISIHILYYGGQFGINMITTQDDLYFVAITVSLSELFSNCALYIYITKLQRVVGTSVSLSLAIITCFCFYFAENYRSWVVYGVLALLERMFITIGFMFLSIHPIEFYPTVIRTIGSGFMYGVGICGSMAAPFLLYWANQISMNPFLMLGLAGFIGPFGILLVPETLGLALSHKILEKIK